MNKVTNYIFGKCFLFLYLSIISFVGIADADVVMTLRDGTVMTVESVALHDGILLLPDGREIPKYDVQKIHYLKGSKGWRYQPTKPDIDEYREYLSEGRRLAEKYPGFDKYLVEDDSIFTWNPDGTSSKESRTIFYLNKEDAKRLSDGTFYVEEERYRYVFLAMRSISKDLQIRNIDPDQIVTAPVDTETRSFSRYLGVSGHIPDAEIGGLLELHVRVENYNPFDEKYWATMNSFQSDVPNSRSSVTVRVPEGMKINFYNHLLPEYMVGPVVKNVGGWTEYNWTVGEMPALIFESLTPPMRDIAPYLVVSPFFDWQYIIDMEKRLLGNNATPDERVKRLTARIVKRAKSDEEKVALIYHWLQKNIRYISIKGSIGSGWGGHPAWLTLQNQFGDCIDKAILMTAMLNACGIEAEVAALMSNGREQLMDKLPILHANHAITRVTLNGKSFYLDSTGSDLRYPSLYSTDQGCVAFLTKSGKVELIQPYDPSTNQWRLDYKIEMDEQGGLVVEQKETAIGPTEAGMRGRLTGKKDKDRREEYMRQAAKLSPSGTLVSFKDTGVEDLAKPVESYVKWKLPNYVRRSGDLRYFSLPYVGTSFGQISLSKRQHDLYVNSSYLQLKNYEIIIPKGYKISAIPEPLEVGCPYYMVKAGYEVNGGTLRFHYRYEQKHVVVPVADYPSYREGLLKVEQYCRQKIFLVPQKEGIR